MGASLGAVVGHATQILTSIPINTGAYALVGMGAYFAGTLRAPIAAVLIVIELTNDYGLILPLMLAVALANTISHAIAPRTLEEDQLKREGFVEPVEARDPLSSLKTTDVMSRSIQTFKMSDSLADVVERTRAVRHSLYPVVDEQHRLLALLSGEEVARAVREERIHATVRDLATPPLIAGREGEELHALLGRMAATTVDRCPVVDHAGVVVGFIGPSDILRARFRTPAAVDETLR
jgi:CIC family chloride channel protein